MIDPNPSAKAIAYRQEMADAISRAQSFEDRADLEAEMVRMDPDLMERRSDFEPSAVR